MLTRQRILRRMRFAIAAWRRIRRWPSDERGVALIEAAIIFPLLVMMFLGMIELSQAFTLKRRVQNVATATADLVAQYPTVTTANLNDIAAIGAQLMLPFSSTGLTLSITSVAEDFRRTSPFSGVALGAVYRALAIAPQAEPPIRDFPPGFSARAKP